VSDPAAPLRLGGYDTPDYAQGVAVVGTRAYVADNEAGLLILDVSDPAAPSLLGRYDSPGNACRVVVVGGLAYLADARGGLQIISVANPAAPALLKGVGTPDAALGITVVGTRAYVAANNSGLVIVDVTNPTAPVQLSAYSMGGHAYGVAVSGTLAYVANRYSAGLVIVDVSNPAKPVGRGSYWPGGGDAWDVTVSGTVAYLAFGIGGLHIVDAANPAFPARLGVVSAPGVGYGVAVSGTVAYLADGKGGLRIFDLSAPGSLSAPDLQPTSDTGASTTDNITADTTPTFDVAVPRGFYFRFYRDGEQISGDWELGSSYTTAVQADGTYRYTVEAVDAAGNTSVISAGLPVTVDTSIPSAPDLVASSDSGISSDDNITNLDNSTPDKSLQFIVGSTIAGATVTIYADGAAIGSAVAEGTTTTVTTNGNSDLADGKRTIAARQTLSGRPQSGESAALTVTVDTTANIMNPARLGGYVNGGYIVDIEISGTRAYVMGEAGLEILDVTNPAVSVRLGTYFAKSSSQLLALSGTLAYVWTFNKGLEIIDVSDPDAPVRLGVYNALGSAFGGSVSGTRAYVANYNAGLEILDITDPTAPARLGGYVTAGHARDVAVSGDLAFVAEDSAGLEILDVTNPSAPVLLGKYVTGAQAYSVAVSGTLAFVASNVAGLEIVDITNPMAPVRVGGYDVANGFALDVAASAKLAYVAAAGAGLHIFDVSNPVAPVRLGVYDVPGAAAWSVAVSGTIAYVADDSAGLQIIDVSMPASLPAPDLQPSSDTGASPTDNNTNDTTPTFDVAVPVGCSFRVYRDGAQISGDYETGASWTAPVQPDGTYNYTIASVDAAGNVSPQGSPLAVTIDSAPAAVVGQIVNGGAAQRSAIGSLAIRFSEDVVTTWDAGDLTLVNRDSGAVIDLAAVTPAYDAASHTATWNLAGVALDDGYYTATLAAAGISDAAGSPLAGGDYAFDFFRLLGDTDGNASVDIFDVANVQVNYGQTSGMTAAEGDFDGNGTVDIFDVALLQVAFGRTLDSPAPAPAAAPSAEALDWADPEPLLSAMPIAADDLAEAIASAPISKPSAGAALPPRPAASNALPSWASVDHRRVQHNGRHAAHRPMQPLAVRHAVENASWESAVDQLLESEEPELAK
ncbi:MAG: Ig-like domain-containing protein, partial [Pirellulales bacterium]